jgi:hypothetical protein
MNAALIGRIVEAVLYEGYILYPYRASSAKNKQRFTFGRVYPEAYSHAQQDAEPCMMQTECLVAPAGADAILNVGLRFLHPIWRGVGRLPAMQQVPAGSGKVALEIVPELEVDGKIYQSWQEAVEREVRAPGVGIERLQKEILTFPFSFPASVDIEPIANRKGETVAVYSRRGEFLQGFVELSAESVGAGVVKVRVRIQNQTPLDENLNDQDAILMRTFASAHTILHVEKGEFLSLMDPPAEHKGAAAVCKNIGTWPVLVGDEARGERDAMLSSPIILYDYPKVAPESPGNMFDATEIDEILTLRVLTLTDAEKREMRQVDGLARHLLERTESLTRKQMLGLHGTFRDTTPFDSQIFGRQERLEGVTVNGIFLRPGDRVKIHPKGRADVMDIALDGKVGIIEAIEQDAEGKVHLPLVVEDDPGRDLGLMRQPGHRFFYTLDEVEPLPKGEK